MKLYRKYFLFFVILLMFEKQDIKGADDDFRDITLPFDYSNNFFTCRMENSGTISNLKFEKKLIFMKNLISARGKINSKGTRIYQTEKVTVSKIKEDADTKNILIKGFLFSTDKTKVVEFEENIVFSSGKVEFRYEVKLLIEMEMKHWNPFFSLLTVPAEAYYGCPLEMLDTNGGKTISGVAEDYRKDLKWPGRLKSMKIVFNDFSAEFATESEAVNISVGDGRAWKSKDLEIIIRPVMRKFPKEDVPYPAGTVFKWTYDIVFDKY